MMQKYKIADNKMFHSAGHDFIFLAAENTIFEMDDRIKGVLTQTGIPEAFTKEDLFSRLSYGAEDRNALFKELMESRVIEFPKTPAPGKKIDFNALNIELKTLVLHVTDACNLGCRYCYYSNSEKTAVSKETMSPQVAQRAVDFLLEHAGALKEVVIVFFGGEPLLNFDLISSVVSYSREKASEKGVRVDFALTTNATLLTDRIIGFLKKNNIGVTISIDGFEAVHDQYRCFPGGAPSYRHILPGLKKLLADKGDKPVVARVTIAGSAGDIGERLTHLLSLGFSEAGFAPVTTSDLSFQLSKKEMDRLLEEFKILSDKFVAYAVEDRFFGFTNLVDNLVVLHEGETKDYPCGAGLGLFSVDPSGRLYLCQRLTGERASHMGDVFNGFNQPALAAFREKSVISEKKECRDCWVRKICAGGCYHEALVREGSLTRANLHYCQWIKDWVRVGLAVYGRLVAECPEYLDKLSLLRGHEPLYSQTI